MIITALVLDRLVRTFKVVDIEDRPVSGLQVELHNTTVKSPQTDSGGLSFLRFLEKHTVGDTVHVRLAKEGKPYFLTSPFDGNIVIPKQSDPQEVLINFQVTRRGERKNLKNSAFLRAVSTEIDRTLPPTIPSDRQKASLQLAATKYGYSEDALLDALNNWTAAADNEVDRGLAEYGHRKFEDADSTLRVVSVANHREASLAHYYRGLALAKLRKFPQALEQYKSAQADFSSDPAFNLNYADALAGGGRPGEAQRLLWNLLEIEERKYGKSSEKLLTILNNLAAVYAGVNEDVQALDLFNRALRLAELHYGTNSIFYAYVRGNRGGSLIAQGKLESARSDLQTALKILTSKFSASNPDVKRFACMLAQIEYLSDNLSAAESLSLDALKPGDGPAEESKDLVILASANLANIYTRQGNPQRAAELLRKLVDTVAVSDPWHQQLLHDIGRHTFLYGIIQQQSGNLREADVAFASAAGYYQSALESRQSDLGNTDHFLDLCEGDLIVTYVRLRRVTDAERLARFRIERFKAAGLESSADGAMAYVILASSLGRHGQDREATKLFVNAISIGELLPRARRSITGIPDVLEKALLNYADFLSRIGKTRLAEDARVKASKVKSGAIF